MSRALPIPASSGGLQEGVDFHSLSLTDNSNNAFEPESPLHFQRGRNTLGVTETGGPNVLDSNGDETNSQVETTSNKVRILSSDHYEEEVRKLKQERDQLKHELRVLLDKNFSIHEGFNIVQEHPELTGNEGEWCNAYSVLQRVISVVESLRQTHASEISILKNEYQTQIQVLNVEFSRQKSDIEKANFMAYNEREIMYQLRETQLKNDHVEELKLIETEYLKTVEELSTKLSDFQNKTISIEKELLTSRADAQASTDACLSKEKEVAVIKGMANEEKRRYQEDRQQRDDKFLGLLSSLIDLVGDSDELNVPEMVSRCLDEDSSAQQIVTKFRELRDKLVDAKHVHTQAKTSEVELRTVLKAQEEQILKLSADYNSRVEALTQQHGVEVAAFIEDQRSLRMQLDDIRRTIIGKDATIKSLESQFLDHNHTLTDENRKLQIQLIDLRSQFEDLSIELTTAKGYLHRKESMIQALKNTLASCTESQTRILEVPSGYIQRNEPLELAMQTTEARNSRESQREERQTALHKALTIIQQRRDSRGVPSQIIGVDSASTIGSPIRRLIFDHVPRDPTVESHGTLLRGTEELQQDSSRSARAQVDISTDLPNTEADLQAIIQEMKAVVSELSDLLKDFRDPQSLNIDGYARHPSVDWSTMKSDIRSFQQKLLRITKDADITKAVQMHHLYVTKQESRQLVEESAKGSIINIDPLKPYWEDLSCKYNELLSDAFTEAFVTKHPTYENHRDVVALRFRKRLGTLRSAIFRSLAKNDEIETE